MPFDIHISIPDKSHAVAVVQQLAAAEHITTEQAAAQLLIEGARHHGKKTPAQKLIGSFSSDEDAAAIDEAMAVVHAHRADFDRVRDFGF
jgi:hypothetical protein